ncbi:MAG TPA: hypothetical protein ENI27_01425 [bacterium]|nr:hypothetical protein [bacterium]
MADWRKYKKHSTQEMRPYVPGESLDGMSVSERDTPEKGGMIARGVDDGALWYVSKRFFNDNYELVDEDPLCMMVDRFSLEMKDVLVSKREEGFIGYDDQNEVRNAYLIGRIDANIDERDWIDVANLACILWNRL